MLVPRTIFHLQSNTDTESSRYALGGINFHRAPDGTPRAVATDGRHLMASTWTEDDPTEYPAIAGCNPGRNGGKFLAVIPTKICKKAPSLAKDGVRSRKPIIARNIAIDEHTPEDKLREDGSAERVSLGATDLENGETLDVATVEGKFPPYTDVFPDTSKAVTVTLTVELLEKMLTTFRKVGVDRVVVAVVDHETGVVVTGQTEYGRESVAGCIMPMSADPNGRKTTKPPVVGWIPTA